MSAIYELKSQIFNQLINEANKMGDLNSEICELSNSDNNSRLNLSKYKKSTSKNLKLNLLIRSINIENTDAKNYHYSIEFNLFLNINNKFYNNSEKNVYKIIEKILKILHSMDFYYCYKISNHNIKTEEININSLQGIANKDIKISWFTNLSLDNNWLN